MRNDYPPDADGDALRRIASEGNDMSRPMEIDYAVTVPDEARGQQLATAAAKRGYRPELYFDEAERSWTVYCTRQMLATHEGVVEAQRELDALSRGLGGSCDGWGTYGNVEAD